MALITDLGDVQQITLNSPKIKHVLLFYYEKQKPQNKQCPQKTLKNSTNSRLNA